MKTKNNLLKGIIIGIGVIVVPLILMSTTYTTEKKNKFEFHTTHVAATIGFILDTETGDLWKVSTLGSKKTYLPEKSR